MAYRYMIVGNYGTHDGNMGQISNKVLTHDKTFMTVKIMSKASQKHVP